MSDDCAWADWNGTEMPLSEVRVSVEDRGFLFGDGIYEVIRVYRGQPFRFRSHIARLQRNLQKLQLAADAEELADRARRLLDRHPTPESTIYIQVTRGVAPRMHRFPSPPVIPNQLVYVRPFQDRYASLRRLGGDALLADDIRWKRCDIKSVNLLANCLGAQAAHEAGCVEAIFVDSEGAVSEGTHTSVFGVRGGAILTAPLGENLLPGITRQLVFALASEIQIPIQEEWLHRERLTQLDELFITGTTTEVLPIIHVDGQPIGSGVPGPIVAKLQQAYQQAILKECGA